LEKITKIGNYFLLVLGVIGTAWFALPAIMPNFWLNEAQPNSCYGTGFVIGFAIALYWIIILIRWNKL